MFPHHSNILLSAMRAFLLLLVFIAGGTILSSGASACDYGGNGEVSGSCGTVTPPPAPAGGCPAGACCGPHCCDNGGAQCCKPQGNGNGPGGEGGSGRGQPISLFTGQETISITDLVVNGTFSIEVDRNYDSGARYDSSLGYGWALNLDKRLYKYADNSVIIRTGCGTRNKYLFVGGTYQWQGKGRQPLLVEQSDGSFILSFSGGGSETYDAQGKLTVKKDARGNQLIFSYDSRGRLPLTGSSPFSVNPAAPMVVAYDYRLSKVEEKLADGTLTGNSVALTYVDSTGRLQKIRANDGREVTYQQDTTTSAKNGNLIGVTGLAGVNSVYQYNNASWPHGVTSIRHDASVTTAYVNTYDTASGKVTKQTFGQDIYDFTYSPLQTVAKHTVKSSTGTILATETSTFIFDADGYTKSIEWVLSNGDKYKKEFTRNSTTNLVDNEKLSEQRNGATAYTVTSSIDYTYDTANNKTEEKVTLASGEVITKTWTYNNGWKASEQIVSSLAPTKLFRTEYTFYYDANSKPINIKDKKRRLDDGGFQTTTYTYNANGKLQLTNFPGGILAQENVYTGDKLTETHWVATWLNMILAPMKKTYGYDANGNVNAITDGKGNVTQMSYDDQRRVIKVTNALNQETHYRYTGKLLTEIESGRTAADGEGQITQRVYTAEGWLQTVRQKKDDGTFVTVASFTYNSAGKPLTSVSYRDGTAFTTRYEYDALNRLTKVTDPASNITQYRYDAMDNRVAMIDAKSRETLYAYDGLNRLTRIEQKGVSPSAITQFTYDAAGNLLTVTDPENRITTYTYDALSRRTQMIQPLGQTVKYAYDEMDRLDYMINARGQKIDYSYMFWGALLYTDYFANETSTASTKRVEYGYDLNGNVTSVKDNTISTNPIYGITYDTLNRTDVVTVSYMPTAVTLDNNYDRYGNRSQLMLQDGATSTSNYTYNKLNQLSAVTLPGSQNFGVMYYQDAGLIKQLTYPSGITAAYQYATSGMVQSITTAGTAGTIDQLTYTYDPVLNINTMASTRDGGTHTYGYDGLDHLTSAQRPANYGIADESYTYDKVGNREISDATQYDYDNNNRITKSPSLTYSYDSDGNQTTRSDGVTMHHDNLNRLVGVENVGGSAIYIYDQFGRRIKKSVGSKSTFYVWDGYQLIAEYDGDGSRSAVYAYFPNFLTPLQMQSAKGIFDVQLDHVQAPRIITDSAKKVVWSQKQAVFGSMIINDDVDANGEALTFNFRFPGQYEDLETGFYYNFYRTYDPSIGRYIQSDPIGLEGDINTYLYAKARPLSLTDYFGLFCMHLPSSIADKKRTYQEGEDWSLISVAFSDVTGPFGVCYWKVDRNYRDTWKEQSNEFCINCKCGSCTTEYKQGPWETKRETGVESRNRITGALRWSVGRDIAGGDVGYCVNPLGGRPIPIAVGDPQDVLGGADSGGSVPGG